MGTDDHTTPSAPAAHSTDHHFPRGVVTVDDLLPGVYALYDRPACTHDTNPDGHRLTFAELCAREPRLRWLSDEIDNLPRRQRGFCAHEVWYGRTGCKARMAYLVGHFAASDDAALCTSAAYEVAYQALYDRLPDCDHDGMCRG